MQVAITLIPGLRAYHAGNRQGTAKRTHAGNVERLDLVGDEVSGQCNPVNLQRGHDERRHGYVDGVVARLQYRRRLSLDPSGSGPADRRNTVGDACGETRLGGERRAQELERFPPLRRSRPGRGMDGRHAVFGRPFNVRRRGYRDRQM